MALSGHLQNFAGGLIVLVFKPYRVGDVVEAQGVSGTVREIQIFHTIIATFDNKTVYVPNGSLSNSVVVNHSREDIRRVQWTVGVEYGENVDKVRAKLYEMFSADERILQDIEGKKPFVGVRCLGRQQRKPRDSCLGKERRLLGCVLRRTAAHLRFVQSGRHQYSLPPNSGTY